MAILTALSFSDADSLLRPYGLVLQALTPLSAGSVNSNFFLTVCGSDGRSRHCFARIYEEQASQGAEFELKLNLVLSENGIPVAMPLHKQDGSLFSLFGGKPFAVYERIDGEVSCQVKVNEARCRAVGKALAQVHCADLQQLSLNPSRFGFPQIRERLEVVRASRRASLEPAVARLVADCTRLEGRRNPNLPQGLIHGDLFRDNVLLFGDEVSGLLDFESASLGCFAYDLMVTILAWCFDQKFELDLMRALFLGYSSVRPLSRAERDALVTEGSVACVRFATTRLTDFSLRVPEGEPPHRDYRRFFARQDALEGGILEPILAAL
jgi:homoserine kinase type II